MIGSCDLLVSCFGYGIPQRHCVLMLYIAHRLASLLQGSLVSALRATGGPLRRMRRAAADHWLTSMVCLNATRSLPSMIGLLRASTLQVVRSVLRDAGFSRTDDPEAAAVVLLNTCAIRECNAVSLQIL